MKTTLSIEGMNCEHCVKAVTAALESAAGVRKAKVNLKAKNAVVEHGEATSVEALKAAVRDAGFDAC